MRPLDVLHGQVLGQEHRQRKCAARASTWSHRICSSSGSSIVCSRLARKFSQPHAVGREHARQRMDEDRRHIQNVGDEAGVLAARRSEAVERVFADVVAAFDRDFLDRCGHGLGGDADVAVGDLFRRLAAANVSGKPCECHRARRPCRSARCRSRRTPPGNGRAGSCRSMHVGVRDGERSAAPVARGPGLAPALSGPTVMRVTVERQDRAAARRDGVDVEHGHGKAHARDFGLEGAFVNSGISATRRSRCRPCRSR